MTPSELHDRLVAIFPQFAAYWESADNLFRETDGSYTVCGVFSHFAHFVREYFPSFQSSALSQLGRLIEDCLTEPHTEISNDTGACFLENMISEEFTSAFVAQLGPRGRECIAELRGDAV
jgi:alpha-amylase/alpha-mannosidase (GH57 family)